MMKRFLAVFSLGPCLLLASCAEGWTEDAQKEYRSQCVAEAGSMYASTAQAESYCQCDLGVVMKHFNNREAVNQHQYRNAADSALIQKELEDCSLKARQ